MRDGRLEAAGELGLSMGTQRWEDADQRPHDQRQVWQHSRGTYLLGDHPSSPERFELRACPTALPRLLGGRSPFQDPPLLRFGSWWSDRRLPLRSVRLKKSRVGGDDDEPSEESVEWILR